MRDFRASSDSSFMNGRSRAGPRGSPPVQRRADVGLAPVGLLTAADLAHRFAICSWRSSPSISSIRSSLRRELSLQPGRILGGDQLLGLPGETLLGHAQQLVEVGATLHVGDLEGAARLELPGAAGSGRRCPGWRPRSAAAAARRVGGLAAPAAAAARR